jgi:hypothetical protein
MNSDLLALARAYMALPGAPKMDMYPSHGIHVHGGVSCLRDDTGARWIDAAGPDCDEYEWLLDLTDDATGGVMLARLPGIRTVDAHLQTIRVGTRIGATGSRAGGATLAEAVARVAVALGRAG